MEMSYASTLRTRRGGRLRSLLSQALAPLEERVIDVRNQE